MDGGVLGKGWGSEQELEEEALQRVVVVEDMLDNPDSKENSERCCMFPSVIYEAGPSQLRYWRMYVCM